MAYKMMGLSMDRDAIPQQLKMSMEHNQEFVRTVVSGVANGSAAIETHHKT